MDGPVVILDNGAYEVKAGFLTDPYDASITAPLPRVIPNGIFRAPGRRTKDVFIGVDFEQCSEVQEAGLRLRLSCEKGFVTDWDAQKAVWDGLFDAKVFNVNTTESTLVVTEPYFNLANIQEIYDQFIFEEYEFIQYWRGVPSQLASFSNLFDTPTSNQRPECAVFVDCGFSFTHVVPVMNNEIVWSSVRRVDVGGKLLTNHLKELVSYRQWNMMDETLIMNRVKEECCFVSLDFVKDLEMWKKNPRSGTNALQYVLPDSSGNKPGFVRHSPGDLVHLGKVDNHPVVVMDNERFSVPEVLFRPKEFIGLDQAGLPETISQSISSLPTDLQGLFWANIGLFGGSTKFPGFKDRLISDLRSYAPSHADPDVFHQDKPELTPYEGAIEFIVNNPDVLRSGLITRVDYLEHGSNVWVRKGQNAPRLPSEPHEEPHGDALPGSSPTRDVGRPKGRRKSTQSRGTRMAMSEDALT